MHAELDPDDDALVDRLGRERPVPHPGFRGRLSRVLADADPGYGPRPARLLTYVSVAVVLGLLLLACGWVAALGI